VVLGWYEVEEQKLMKEELTDPDEWSRTMRQAGVAVPYETGGPLYEGGPSVYVVKSSMCIRRQNVPMLRDGEVTMQKVVVLLEAKREGASGEPLGGSYTEDEKTEAKYFFRLDGLKESRMSSRARAAEDGRGGRGARSKVVRIVPPREMVDTRQEAFVVGTKFRGASRPAVPRSEALQDGLLALQRATVREVTGIEQRWRETRTVEQLAQLYPVEDSLDDWLTGSNLIVDDMPKELRRLHGEVTLQLYSLVVKHPKSLRAWAFMLAYPFPCLQSSQKFNGRIFLGAAGDWLTGACSWRQSRLCVWQKLRR
jgi:hypothetical protein